MSSLPRSPALASYAGERGGAVCCPISLADLLGKGRTILSASGIPRNEKRPALSFQLVLVSSPILGRGSGHKAAGISGDSVEEEWSFGALREGKERFKAQRRLWSRACLRCIAS